MTEMKIESFPLIEVSICEKIILSNKMAPCMSGEDIGNILFHLGTGCCLKTRRH
jgi:hypothetical protein